MLSIMDPVDIDDLVVCRDDEDPRKFYLLPDEPVISTNEQGVPDFYFIQYRGVDAAHKEGGYVQFRTVLTISPDRVSDTTLGTRFRPSSPGMILGAVRSM